MAPVLLFLVAITVLAELAEVARLFDVAAGRAARLDVSARQFAAFGAVGVPWCCSARPAERPGARQGSGSTSAENTSSASASLGGSRTYCRTHSSTWA
jgi:hypothetical protein